MPLKPDSLAFALTHAAQVVSRVREGTSLPAALAAQTRHVQSAQARGAIQDLAYRTMRRLGSADALIQELVSRPPAAAVHDLLAVALALLSDHLAPAYAPHTTVSQAVEAAAADHATQGAKGLVNAVLRRYLREQQALDAMLAKDPQAHLNMPHWWLQHLRRAWPEQWEDIVSAGQMPPPMTLRINTTRQALDTMRARLAAAGHASDIVGPQALRLHKPAPVSALPGFAEGDISVQDAGAQLAAPLLEAAPGMRVLDACAAPGGKTGHLLELGATEVVAVESDATRARRIQENLDRLGLAAQIIIGDAAHPEQWWDGRPFDRILADVPCSASGIVRRHPDIRWLRRASDIDALQQQQRDILSGLWKMLAPGGRLLYVTCSVFPEEGEMQACWFEDRHEDALRLQAPGQLLPVAQTPDENGYATDHDGFFYALFEKQSSAATAPA